MMTPAAVHTDELCTRPTVPVRVVPAFATYRAEVEYIIGVNAERRQLTKSEVAFAYRRLKELPKGEGGTKGQRGGDHGNQHTGGKRQTRASAQLPESRVDSRADEAAAAILGVGAHEARALEKVFCTPGVPDELKRAVNQGTLAPTPAAKAVQTELKRQGRQEER